MFQYLPLTHFNIRTSLNTKYGENRTTIYFFYVDFLFRKKNDIKQGISQTFVANRCE